MKANNRYYPMVPTEPVNPNHIELGISMRDKLAHDYLCALISRGKGFLFYNNEIHSDVIQNIDLSFKLADLFIKKSEEGGK